MLLMEKLVQYESHLISPIFVHEKKEKKKDIVHFSWQAANLNMTRNWSTCLHLGKLEMTVGAAVADNEKIQKEV